MSQVSHLNELHDEFSERGLTVVGVTGEALAPTKAWMDKHGGRYAYGIEQGSQIMRGLNLSSYPSAALVAPDGTVLWTGSPGAVNGAMLEKHLDGAFSVPVYEWPKALKKAAKLFSAGQLGKAHKEATKVAEKDQSLASFAQGIQKVAEGRVAGLRSFIEGGNWLAAATLAKDLKKSLKPLPLADEADDILRSITSNREAKKVIKGQQRVAKILQKQPRMRREALAMIKQLESVEKALEGTAAAREAKAAIKRLRAQLPRLP